MRITVRDAAGQPIDLLGTPFHIEGSTLPSPAAPPGLGEHTDQVFRELLDLDPTRLADLRARGII
jgi:crotonobetainyl-CoA:carnitine CoA-transferase CaiB-like acyl-CoA transferase